MPASKKPNTIVTGIYRPGVKGRVVLPVYGSRIPAGFPSPADDFVEKKLDLNEHLIKNPAATFIVKVSGNSMTGAGIHSGDHLLVDRSLEPGDRKIVVAALDGELTVKRLRQRGGKMYLASENPDYPEVKLDDLADLKIWGVVTFVIHKV
jgi:DNA polymerase V